MRITSFCASSRAIIAPINSTSMEEQTSRKVENPLTYSPTTFKDPNGRNKTRRHFRLENPKPHKKAGEFYQP